MQPPNGTLTPSHELLNLLVVNQAITNLAAFPRNVRTHPKQQIRQIADSIKAFGFVSPILVNKQNTIIAGHRQAARCTAVGHVSRADDLPRISDRGSGQGLHPG